MATILVIEEDIQYSRALARILKKAGHGTVMAKDAARALACLEQRMPDLILIDLPQPPSDGFALARAIQANAAPATIPFIFLSDDGDAHARVMGLQCGASDCIAKPFHRAELLARIDATLRVEQQMGTLRRQNALLQILARTDVLTELPNRRAFMERLDEEMARVIRHCQPLSLLMLDIDHFKQVNDAILHAGGDEVLRVMTRCIRDRARRNDMVARIGGEEFAVLCPDTFLTGAQQLAERMRAAVERLYVEGKTPMPITVSIGVVSVNQNSAISEEGLMTAADSALYEAKRTGRNRVVCACNSGINSLPQTANHGTYHHVQSTHITRLKANTAENTPQRI
ncbi:MAG TPA: diguanylate cyclase [Armatimonadota bacterium]|nr:diguanylate cyclase [Armatimonadota bacterium]